MPHVLYNHITHTWDGPEPDDGFRESAHLREEAPEFRPATQRVLAGVALAAGTAMAAVAIWGLVAGILLGIS